MIALVTAILQAILDFFKWKHDEDLRQDGRAQQQVNDATDIKDDAATADAVRKSVASGVDAKPDSVRDPDEFERPD